MTSDNKCKEKSLTMNARNFRQYTEKHQEENLIKHAPQRG